MLNRHHSVHYYFLINDLQIVDHQCCRINTQLWINPWVFLLLFLSLYVSLSSPFGGTWLVDQKFLCSHTFRHSLCAGIRKRTFLKKKPVQKKLAHPSVVILFLFPSGGQLDHQVWFHHDLCKDKACHVYPLGRLMGNSIREYINHLNQTMGNTIRPVETTSSVLIRYFNKMMEAIMLLLLQ